MLRGRAVTACYLPTNNRIPANSAIALVNLLGITKRANAGRPFRISQIANSTIPTVILIPFF
jgi:xanthosine utilization system XapX-like protein